MRGREADLRSRRGERLVAVITVLLVLTLVGGVTTVVAERRIAAEPRPPRTAAWFGGAQPAPLPQTVVPRTSEATAAPAPAPQPTQDALEVTSEAEPPAPVKASAPVAPTQAAPAPQPQPAPAPAPAAPPQPQPQPQPQPSEQRMQAASAESESERIFRQQFPTQAAAGQSDSDRSSLFWAVLVGVNNYQGRTSDTTTSVADALTLRQVLLERGWRDDHILLLTDATATHDNIVRGMEWLARKTDDRSVVVFSMSGHMRYQKGDPDGDGEARDSGLWPVDNRFIWDSDFARMMGAVRASRMWISFQGCHAGGMNDPGLQRAGRLITYSSLESQKSYEDPSVGHSVQGWFLFAEGLRDRYGDANSDGAVSVQEAYQWSAPRAQVRTSNRQSPQLYDGLGRPFLLEAV